MLNFEVFFKKLRIGEVYFDNFPNERLLRFKEKTYPLLLESVKTKDEGLLSDVLSVLFYDGADFDFTDVLLKILNEDWHYSHEDIVEVLDLIKDPRSIEPLYKLIIEDDEDEMKSLSKKCMYALRSINNADSINKLKLLEESDEEIIRENASFLLEKIRTQK
ncbi:conserved hypothetical protein [Tenacibaculum sp. 190524A02b]|uniref:HEAT repeat domain-containing protein n=1 Tax=Tenacibaculum vairaonense TaxID=3137860 RepID=A0ABM9PIX1_9FLAO